MSREERRELEAKWNYILSVRKEYQRRKPCAAKKDHAVQKISQDSDIYSTESHLIDM